MLAEKSVATLCHEPVPAPVAMKYQQQQQQVEASMATAHHCAGKDPVAMKYQQEGFRNGVRVPQEAPRGSCSSSRVLLQ